MEEMTLKDWTVQFVKNKDLLQKALIGYDEEDSKVVFHFKDKDRLYFVVHKLDDASLSFIKDEGFKSIVCFANKTNFQFLIKGLFHTSRKGLEPLQDKDRITSVTDWI